MRLPPTPLLLAALLGLSQCKKSDPDPVSQLPPATQTGANTFGCLVNGQPWTPQGNDGTSNYTVSYDRNQYGGSLEVKAYRLVNGFGQFINFGCDSISTTATYSLNRPSRSAFFTDTKSPTNCQNYDGQLGQYRRGNLTITRLDRQAGIVSGTFAFTLYKPGCDSICITNGRFDRQL